MFNLVACCSALPDRVLNGALERAIESVLAQTGVDVERVFVHYPKTCKRLNNEPYPTPPPSLLAKEKVQIMYVDDHGPLTKAYPVTEAEGVDDNTAIVLFDDDRVYPPSWLSPLYAEFVAMKRRAGIGYQGSLRVYGLKLKSSFSPHKRKRIRVGMLATSWLVVYPRRAFPVNTDVCLQSLYALPKDAYTNDDIVIAAWAHAAGVKLYLVPIARAEIEEWERINREDDQFVQQHQFKKYDRNPSVRMLMDDRRALTNTSGQHRKQIRLASKLLCQRKLPMLVGWLVFFLSLIIIVTLAVLIPVRLVSLRKV